MLLNVSVSSWIWPDGHDLLIAVDNTGVVTNVAFDANMCAFFVRSNNVAVGTRAGIVAEAIDVSNDTGTWRHLYVRWLGSLGKSQRWECRDESENGNERRLYG